MAAQRASFEQKVAFLRRPESWPAPTRTVELVETHLACVFLTDFGAYKLKRPIRYHGVDYSTVEGRRVACEQEVVTNRRLAAEVYRGVVALRWAPAGGLTFDPVGEPVDWLVDMVRLPRRRMLDAAIGRGHVRDAELRAVARTLAAFHRAQPPAERDPDAHVARLTRLTVDDLAALRGRVDGIPESTLAAIEAAQSEFLGTRDALVKARVRAGRVIDGHGDLRPEHVCLVQPPVIIDALEFDGDLRTLDAISDIVFLVLECDRLGAPQIGAKILSSYLDAAHDDPDPALLRFYRRQHACARAKLAVWHTAEPGPRGPTVWLDKARAYLGLALETLGPG